MKINSILPDSSSSTKTADKLDSERSNTKQIKRYPNQDQLKSILDPTWLTLLTLLLSVTTLIIAAEYLCPEDQFLDPCNYENYISFNDTLKLKGQLHEKQSLIETYESHLLNDITVNEREKFNLKLENAVEESVTIKQEFNYHKNQWRKCFTQNRDNFGIKVKTSQSIFSFLGLAISGYQLFKFLQYLSKIKGMNLTKEQKDAYEKDWRGIAGFKIDMFFKFLFFILFICFFQISLWKIYPQKMPI